MHTIRLAQLVREGKEFPLHEEVIAPPGGGSACLEFGVHGEVMPGGRYLHYWCPDCDSHMYQANSSRGIFHGRKISKGHKPVCCAERKSWGRKSIWPDEE